MKFTLQLLALFLFMYQAVMNILRYRQWGWGSHYNAALGWGIAALLWVMWRFLEW